MKRLAMVGQLAGTFGLLSQCAGDGECEDGEQGVTVFLAILSDNGSDVCFLGIWGRVVVVEVCCEGRVARFSSS